MHRWRSRDRSRAGGAVASTARAPEAEAIAAEERLERIDRRLRRWAILCGAPLALTLLVPWPHDDELRFAWELGDALGTRAPIVLPAIGAVAVLLGVVTRIPRRVRAMVAGALAVALGWQLVDLLLLRAVFRAVAEPLRAADLGPYLLGVAAILGAATCEHFVQLRRASRWRAFIALFAWLHVLVRAFLPLAPDHWDPTSTIPFVAMAEAISHADRGDEMFTGLGFALVGLVTFLGVATGVWRALSPMPFRPHVRFRSAWLALALGVAPAAGVLLLFAFEAVSEHPSLALAGLDTAAYLFALLAGLPLFAAHALDALTDGAGDVVRDLRAEDAPRKRRARRIAGVAFALVLCLAAWPVVRAVLPDSRDATAGDFLEDAASAVLASTMGGEIDPRYLGGYSELDLRGSRGELAERIGANASVDVRLTAIEVVVVPPSGGRAPLAVVRSADGDVGWTGAWEGRVPDMVADAPGALGDIFSRANDAAGTMTCLPRPSPSVFDGLPPAARAELADASALERHCAERRSDGSWIDGWLDRSRRSGALGAMVIWVRANGRIYALHSHAYASRDHVWLGRAEITAY